MKKQYYVILTCGEMLVRDAHSLAELIEMLKLEGLRFKDVAVIHLRVEVYEYHWR